MRTGEDNDRDERPGETTPGLEGNGSQDEAVGSRQAEEEQPIEKRSRESLMASVQDLEKSRDENYERYLRSQAEMENMKKRHQKEKKDWQRFANEKLIKEILPVMDNLEMALSHAEDGNALEGLREGVALTLKGLREALGQAGVEEVKTEGEPFDPCYHEAISVQEDPNREAGTVLHELKKGYVLNDRLIRPALVVVNQKAAGEGGSTLPNEACESNNSESLE